MNNRNKMRILTAILLLSSYRVGLGAEEEVAQTKNKVETTNEQIKDNNSKGEEVATSENSEENTKKEVFIPEDGETLMEVDVKGKSEYLDGIIKDKELYVDKDAYLELIEFYKNGKDNNKKRIKLNKEEIDSISIESNGKKFINFQKFNEILKSKYIKIDYDKGEANGSVPWKLDYELEKDILDARKFLKKDTGEESYHKEEWKKWTPGMLGVGYSRTDRDTTEQSAYFNYVNNIYYGSFDSNVTVEEGQDDEEGTDVELDYAYWEKDIDRNKSLTFGDTYIMSPFDVADTNGSIVGASIGLENSWDSKMRVTQKSVSGYVASGTVVELYENGVLKDVQTVTGGQYKFNVELSNGSKEYTIKKYMANGEVSVEKVTMAGDEKVLPKGVFDYQVAGGGIKEKESEGAYYLEGRYGLLKDTTISVGAFNLYNEDYESKDFTSGGIANLIDMPWGTGTLNNTFTYAGNGGDNSMYRYRSWYTKGPVTLGYKYEDYEELETSYQGTYSKFQNIYADFDLPDGSSFKVGRANYTMTNNMDNYDDEDEEDEYGNKYTYDREDAGDDYEDYYANWNKSYQNINFNVTAKDSNNETSDERDKTLSPGFTYSFEQDSFMKKVGDSISCSMEFSDNSEDATTYDVSLDRNDAGEWEWTLEYSNDDEGGNERFGVMVSYTPGRVAKYTVDIRKDDNGTDVTSSVETMVHLDGNNKPKISYPETMGRGLIKGKVYVDRDGDGEFDQGKDELLEHSKIETTSDDSYSNENGVYTLAGVSTASIEEVRVITEEKYLPYSVKPVQTERVKLNPGGQYDLDFKYLPNVSIVSTLEFEKGFYLEEVESILPDTEIELKNLRTGEIVKTSWGNSDILITTIPVGKYSVKINYLGEDKIEIDKKEYLLELEDIEETDLIFKISKDSEKVYSLKVLNSGKELYSLLELEEKTLSMKEEELKKLREISMNKEELKKLKEVSMKEKDIKKLKKVSMAKED